MTGVAKILLANASHIYTTRSPHAGMGIILDSRHVLTCAHVVNRSLDEAFEEVPQPADRVPITFPKLDGPMQTMLGRVLLWSPMGDTPTSDLAVLEFDDHLPTLAGLPSFSDSALGCGQFVKIFGVKAGETEGNIVNASYNGDVEHDLGQIDGGSGTQAFIAGGYSGAAVTDSAGNVIGMVTARNEGAELIAYMVHWKTLRQFLGAHSPTPAMPALEGRADKRPLIVHTYSLLDTKLFGRNEWIENLNRWAQSDGLFGVIENHGGFGKSALAYTWFLQQFRVSNPTQDWDGGIWYSFYEPGARYRDFLERLYSYCSGTTLPSVSELKLRDLEDKLEVELRKYRLLIVLDGFEAMLNAYGVLRAESHAFRDFGSSSRPGELPQRPNDRSISVGAFAEFLLQLLKKAQCRSKLLFTTRIMPTEFESRYGKPKDQIERFDLVGLDLKGAQDYWQACGLNHLDPELPQFVAEVGGHPLALSIMAGVMSASKTSSIAEFRAFDTDFSVLGVLSDHKPVPRPDRRSRRSDVFQAALKLLSEQQRVLLVRIASYRQPAPLDELEQMFVSPSWRADKSVFANRAELVSCLDALQGLRLIGYQVTERSYDMHPVVRAVVRQRTSADDWDNATEAVVEELENKPPRFEVRGLKDISDELLIFHCKIDLGRYEEAALRYAGSKPGDLRPALSQLGEWELEAELLGKFFKIDHTGRKLSFKFCWDGDQNTGLTAESDFSQELARARNAKGAWEEALEFHALHRSCGLCQDPLCATRTIDTLQALGRLAEAERVFTQCRADLRKFSRDAFRELPEKDPYRRRDNYDHRLNYANYRLASAHFWRAVDRKNVQAARLSLVRSQSVCAKRFLGTTYWFQNEGELLRSRNLGLAALALIENKPDCALLISREVKKKAEEHGHLADEARALLSMARSHFAFNERQGYFDAEACVKDYLEHLQLRSRDRHSRMAFSAWCLLAEILVELKRLDEAEHLVAKIEERVAVWSDVCKEAKACALRARLCDAQGRPGEAIEQWLLVLNKLTVEPDTPADEPLIVEAMKELKRQSGALSQARRRALRLGPPARDSWLAINPFDRYWAPWFGARIPLTADWQMSPKRSNR